MAAQAGAFVGHVRPVRQVGQWRHEIARGFACFCKETVQGCSAAVITQGHESAARPVVKRAVVVIKICDGIGGMHGCAGGRMMGIMGIMGTVRIMGGLRL